MTQARRRRRWNCCIDDVAVSTFTKRRWWPASALQFHLLLLGCVIGMGPVKKNSRKRAPGPMTARGDSLRCSRNPGSNFRSGLIAPREYRPRCRRRRRVAKVSCTAGRAKSDGNFIEQQYAEIGLADAHRVGQYGVKNRLQIAGR